MDSQFHRILALVRRTGDRMVVTDPNGDDVYVVMGIDQYEDLLGESDFDDDETWRDRLMDDDEIWDSTPLVGEPLEPSVPHPPASWRGDREPPRDVFEAMPPAGSKAETWDVSKMNQHELEQVKHAHEQSTRTSAPRDPLAPHVSQDASEDQYYLEPIE